MENHKITIKNLGPIKELIDFEIKKFNLLIGKSAAGKSVLARAILIATYTLDDWIYFPRGFIDFKKSEEQAAILFRILFPHYHSYKIEYQYTKELVSTIERKGDKISFKYSPKMKKLVEEQKQTMANLSEQPDLIYREGAAKAYESLKFALGLSRTIFIPAARSVISDFDRSRMKMLNRPWAGNNEFSPDLSILDEIFAGDITLKLFSNDNSESIRNFQKLPKAYEKIAKGTVHKRAEQIFLTTEDGKQTLPIDQLSSGQKEVIPILMLLQYIMEQNIKTLLIIEEPEAHLFPEDQAALLDKIVEVANKTDSKVFITTHSPILLMEANNLMTAEEKQYTKLKSRFLRYDDVQANSISNGKCKSIKDGETRLIDGRYIEDVTDKIMEEFDKIVESK